MNRAGNSLTTTVSVKKSVCFLGVFFFSKRINSIITTRVTTRHTFETQNRYVCIGRDMHDSETASLAKEDSRTNERLRKHME